MASDIRTWTKSYYVPIVELSGWNELGRPLGIGMISFWLVFEPREWLVVRKDLSILGRGSYQSIAKIELARFYTAKLPTIYFKDGRELKLTNGTSNDIYDSRHYRLPTKEGESLNGNKMTQLLQKFIKEMQADKDVNRESDQNLIPAFNQKSLTLACHFLGGYGLSQSLEPSAPLIVGFNASGLSINAEELDWSDLVDLSIGGPGLYQTGGGWFGGGFGVTGALEGAAFAAVMNLLTTKTQISTVIRIIFNEAEVNLHTSVVTPEILDNQLSAIRGFLKKSRTKTDAESIPKFELNSGFCTLCGNQRRASDIFCAKCGNRMG